MTATRCGWSIRSVLAVIVIALGPLLARGAGEPLSATFIPEGMARSEAPRKTRVDLLWNGSTLLEGELHLRVTSGRSTISHTVVKDMALAPGTQSFTVLLPPATVYGDGLTTRVALAFKTANDTIDLGMHAYPLPSMSQRRITIMFPMPPVGSDAVRSLAAELRPDWLNPEVGIVAGEPRFRSGFCPLRPEDFPTIPELYCTADVVLLTGATMHTLSKDQIDALHQWLRGGGSLCVTNPSEELPPHIRRWLTELFAEPHDVTGIDVPLPTTRVTRRYVALGRAVLLRDTDIDTESLRDDPAWRQLLAFLWHMRNTQTQTIGETGKWDAQAESAKRVAPIATSEYHLRQMTREFRQSLSLEPLDLVSSSGYLSLLMPRDMQFVSIWKLAGVLLILIIVIGPLDYIVLKRFRLQRFTWVTVPVYVAIATVVIVTLANRAMGRHERRGTLCILDTDTTGTPVRQNDIHMIIPARHGTLQEPVRNRLTSPINVGINSPYGGRTDTESSSWKRLEGRYPHRFTAVVDTVQWSPFAWRSLSLRPTREFPWQLPEDAEVWDARGRQRFWESFVSMNDALPEGVFLLQGSSMYPLREQRLADHHTAYGQLGLRGLVVLAEAPRVGYFSLVSAVSPNGGPALEDLYLFDATDPDHAVLVLVWRDGDTYLTSRTAFYKTRTASASP